MNDMMLWTLMIVGEVLFILFVLLLVAWIRSFSAARRDKLAMRKLVAKVKENRTQREQQVVAFLKNNLGLQGEALEAAAAAAVHGELRLLQAFAAVYGKRDAAQAARFDLSVEAAIDPYHALAPASAGAGAGGGEGVDDGAELARLLQENTRLEQELSITMDTLSRMLNEYATMFGGGMPGGTRMPTMPGPAEGEEPADVDTPPEGGTADEGMVADQAETPEEPAEADDFDDIFAAADAEAGEGDAAPEETAADEPMLADAGEPDLDGADVSFDVTADDDLDPSLFEDIQTDAAETVGELDETVLAERPAGGESDPADELDIQLADDLTEDGLLDMEGLFDESAPDEDILSGEFDEEDRKKADSDQVAI